MGLHAVKCAGLMRVFYEVVASLRDAVTEARPPPHTAAVALYGVNCTACVLPLRGCPRKPLPTVAYCLLPVVCCLLPIVIRLDFRNNPPIQLLWLCGFVAVGEVDLHIRVKAVGGFRSVGTEGALGVEAHDQTRGQIELIWVARGARRPLAVETDAFVLPQLRHYPFGSGSGAVSLNHDHLALEIVRVIRIGIPRCRKGVEVGAVLHLA